MHDIAIRNGRVIDGTGTPEFHGDVAVDGATITAVGDDVGKARREIDAEGKLVVPGWIDIHTHFDAQVSWDPYLTPSCWNGVTTIVMGNCGVGFAPVKPKDLSSEAPYLVYDLPENAKRYMQRPQGYDATICAGEVVLENDEVTGALLGRLVRSRPAA